MWRSNYFTPVLLFLAILLLLASCGEENSRNSDHIDQFTGIDTTKALITQEEFNVMDKMVLIPFRDGPLWGFADTLLQIAIPARYQKVQQFSENLAVVMADSMYGVIDKMGRELIPPQFSYITRSACGVFTIKSAAGFIIVNNQGKRVTQKVYQGTFSYTCTEDRIPIMDSGKVAFFDPKGRAVTGFDYDAIYKFQHGLAPVRIGSKVNGKWGAINKSGQMVIPVQYEMVFPFVSGLGVAIRRDEAGEAVWGVLDTLGNTVLPFEFGRISGAFRGEYVVSMEKDPMQLWMEGRESEENHWYIYDRQGQRTGESENELIDDFSEGLVVMSRDSLYGFADHTGKIVIPAKYDWACGFKLGMAWVRKKGLYGFIDHQGKTVIPFKYAAASDYVFMDIDGVKVLDPQTGEAFYIDPYGNEFRSKQ